MDARSQRCGGDDGLPRKRSEYAAGDFWLEKRPKSPFWQITRYNTKTRGYLYRSTHCESLEDAKSVLDAYVAGQRALEQGQEANEAHVVPLLMAYWQERGKKAINCDQAAQHPHIHRISRARPGRCEGGRRQLDPCGV